MELYQSAFLSIQQENDTLVQTWSEQQLDVEDYKRELGTFMELFRKAKPSKLVWDTRKCQLVIPQGIEAWMGERVLIPIYQKGIRELVFAIPESMPVHLSVVKSLEKAQQLVQARYFSDFDEARDYSERQRSQARSATEASFECAHDAPNNALDIRLKLGVNDLPHFLHSMKQLEADRTFIEQHRERYATLTLREIQVLKLIARGNTNKQIAAQLFIEDSSIKTHRKNIKRKLGIASNFDLYQYARCFQLL